MQDLQTVYPQDHAPLILLEFLEKTLLKVRLMDKKLKWLKIEQLKKEK
jgi:hypothetical protein